MTVPPLHVVTDDAVLARPDFVESAARALEAGRERLALHLRGPATPTARLFGLAEALIEPAHRAGSRIIINDRIDVALAVAAHGVQLGHRSLPIALARRRWPGLPVGASVHDKADAIAAERDGTDWILLGTIYPTTSHPGRPGAGTRLIEDTTRAVGLPVVAIGGITPDHVGAVKGAGARGHAVLGGIWRAGDPAANVVAYLKAWEAGREST